MCFYATVVCWADGTSVTADTVSATLSSFSTMASHGSRFCNSMRYFGWLIAYTYGSKQATNLHVHAGIIVTAGVSNALSPNAPMSAITPYGVQAKCDEETAVNSKRFDFDEICIYSHATKRKQIVIAAFAIRTSADCEFDPWFARNESTFIFFACSRNFFSWLNTCLTIWL